MISTLNTKQPWGLMDLDFVWQFRNKEATNYTYVRDQKVGIPELNTILQREGLKDPLVLRLYFENNAGTIRLEEGNHRLQVLRVFETQVPVVVEIASTPIGSIHNGIQLYPLDMSMLHIDVSDLSPGRYSPDDIFQYGSGS